MPKPAFAIYTAYRKNLLDRSSDFKKRLPFPLGAVPQKHLHIGIENIFFRGLLDNR